LAAVGHEEHELSDPEQVRQVYEHSIEICVNALLLHVVDPRS